MGLIRFNSYRRKPHCGYCWQEGHNRITCPEIKKAAAAGDTYAQERLERSKIKQCSYCNSIEHTKATCNKKFQDDLRIGWIQWAGISAMASFIKEKKYAKGAFIYGPIPYRGHAYPTEVPGSNYEFVNYLVEDLNFENFHKEFANHVIYTTLHETENNRRLRMQLAFPFFREMINNLPADFFFGVEEWKADQRYSFSDMSMDAVNTFQILVEASQESVDNTVRELMNRKPLIVDYTDRETYAKEMRRRAKLLKKQENVED